MAYFSHDLGARNSAALLKVRMKMGAEGYGLYFMILERLAEAKDHVEARDYDAMAYELHADADKIRMVVEDFGLFELAEVNGKASFYSASLMKRLQTDSPRVAAAKKAANTRWGNIAETDAQNASCDNENASKRIGDASCEIAEHNANEETQNANDAYLKENKIKENKIKEINPPQSTQARTREAIADGPSAEEENLIFKIFSSFERVYKEVDLSSLVKNKSATTNDLMKIRRYLTDDDRRNDVLSLIGAWGNKPIHELIQCMNSMEQQSQLHPMQWEWWKALDALHSMIVTDQRKVKKLLMEHPEKWEDYVEATKEVTGNKKILNPTRFIISRIS